MSARVSFAEDPALWIATAGSTLLALIGVPLALYGAFMFLALAEPEAAGVLALAASFLPVVAGLVLLEGYWRELRRTHPTAAWRWWGSLIYNVCVVAACVGLSEVALLPLAAWGLFMGILSGHRALGHAPLAAPVREP